MSSLPVDSLQPGLAEEPQEKEQKGNQWYWIRAMVTPRMVVAMVMVLAIITFAFVAPFVTGRTDPLTIVGPLFSEPDSEFLLGTDNFGRDVLTQLMHGTRTSLIIGTIAGAVATTIGVLIGLTAGYFGGFVEEILMGLTNVVITIPSIVVLILLSTAVGTKTTITMALIIGVTAWPWTARAVRAQASSVRTREHVDLARITGASTLRLMFFEVLPYMFSYIFMAFVLQLTSAILQEATLSMLGLGPSSAISLGVLLNWALLWESVRQGNWWTFVPATIMLTAIAYSLYLLQSSLDEIFNPRLRRQ